MIWNGMGDRIAGWFGAKHWALAKSNTWMERKGLCSGPCPIQSRFLKERRVTHVVGVGALRAVEDVGGVGGFHLLARGVRVGDGDLGGGGVLVLGWEEEGGGGEYFGVLALADYD